MIRRPPRSTRKESSAASDVYKRQSLSSAGGCMLILVEPFSLLEMLPCPLNSRLTCEFLAASGFNWPFNFPFSYFCVLESEDEVAQPIKLLLLHFTKTLNLNTIKSTL
eukprot:TRINITY_DN9882_c0_g3_i2.p1 TRINITY_DN9882_c0_g3~~TRINITY_DN9882_c0_g3_i2.p1  ORF type:complete len:119 (+),score=7.22 TRINITY_DN9882_c0_g3_i2:35-358(+)